MMVTFPSGESTASLSVPIMDDSIVESTELFSALLTTTEPNVMLGVDTATITIQDNDGEIILYTLFSVYYSILYMCVHDLSPMKQFPS